MTITNGETREWTGEVLKVSNSEIQTWKDCHRKWWFVYYRQLGLKRENRETSGPRSLGTRVHLALEGMYTNDANALETLKEIYDYEIENMQAKGAWETDLDAIRKEYDLANAMVSGYLQWVEEEGIDDGIELVAAEDVVEVPSAIPGIMLRGKMDQRVVRTLDSARLFRDFKTVQELTTPAKILPIDEQMKFYMLLEYIQSLEATGGEPQWRTDGGLYTMIRKVKRTASAKPPFYGQLEVHHNIETIRSMWKRVARVIEELYDARVALDAGADHQYIAYPRPSRDCTWKCDFFAVCAMADDGSDLDGMLDSYYEHLDPHERYDKEDTKGDGKE